MTTTYADKLGLIGSHELAERTGATYRQIDYWRRTGRIVPVIDAQGCGSKVIFDEAIVPRVRAMAALSHFVAGGYDRGPIELFEVIGRSDGPWSIETNGVRLTVEVVA